MPPYIAPTGTVAPRNPSTTGYVPGLPISSLEHDKRDNSPTLSSPPYLNHTIRSTNLTARSDHNITTRSELKITARSDINITALGHDITPRTLNLTARGEHNHTLRSDLNSTSLPRGKVIARTTPAQAPYLNSTVVRFHQTTVRSDQNLTARSNFNLTERSDTNLTARSEYNLQNLTARTDHNLTARSDVNSTAWSDYQSIAARSELNLTGPADFNLTARSDLNLTTRSDSNLTARSDFNLTARSDFNLTARSDDKMIVNPNYNLSSVHDGRSPKDVQSAHRLVSRATTTYLPCQGCTDPRKINNNAFFALFALLGVGIVVGSIWFFFHAKNGGFVWQQNDWDDYKSTVLRRKGPDGKTLSNATKSTRLGGGSIVARHDKLAAMTVVGYDEKGRKGIRAKRGFGGTHSVYYSDDFSNYDGSRADDMSEIGSRAGYHHKHQTKIRGGHASNESDASKHHSRRYRDRDVHEYKHEKPARVGGMNRQADGSAYDYSDRYSDSMTQITESTNRSTANLIANKEPSKPPKDTVEKKRARAEKKASEEARRMERQWRKDAEAAARAIARDNAPSPIPPQQAHRKRADSRSKSPKKRDYSFSKGQDDNSTVTGTTTSGTRTTSYYDSYRPKHEGAHERAASKTRGGSPSKGYRRYAESDAETSDTGTRSYAHTLNKGPAKEKKTRTGGRDVMAGYRRGRDEDDF